MHSFNSLGSTINAHVIHVITNRAWYGDVSIYCLYQPLRLLFSLPTITSFIPRFIFQTIRRYDKGADRRTFWPMTTQLIFLCPSSLTASTVTEDIHD